MANNIKGITIEIGGNTLPLEKALKSVNDKTFNLQGELREVNRLLKLDPKNTELLAQKQKLLSQSVENTKEKLSALKEAEKQVQQEFEKGKGNEEQYRALQREIIKTEQDLIKLEGQSSKTNQVLGKVSVAADKMAIGMGKTGKAMLPITGAIAGAGIASVTMATQFADSMAKVSTIADTTQVPMDSLKKQILDLSNQTGVGANLIADDVYNAISAGQSTADAVNFVTNSTKLAKAGFAESSQAVDVLTTILNSYGLEAEKVTDVSDMLIQVQNKGKTTVAELSANMGKVIPTAKGQNVALEQLGAGYAIMTSKGIATAETTTYLNGMINELGKSSSISAKLLKEETGKSFSELMGSGKSLADVLKIVEDDAKKSGKSMGDMFGSAEAAKAALTLIDGGVDDFNKSVFEMKNSVGSTDEAFKKLQTPSEKLKISLNNIKNSAIKMGDALSPVFSMISELIAKVANKLASFDQETLKTIAIIAGIVAVIAPTLIIAGKIAGVISAVSGAMATLKTATLTQTIAQWGLNASLLASPITWIVIGVAAIVAAFVLLWNNCEGFRKFWIDLWNGIVAAFNATVSWFSTMFTVTIPSFFSGLMTWITNIFLTDWTKKFGIFGEIINGFFASVKNIFDGVKTIFTGIIDFIKNVFTGNWSGAWEAVKQIFKGIFDTLIGIAKAPLNGIIGLINLCIGGINMLIQGLNKISFDIPDWKIFGDLAGMTFGINIPEIPNIPYLAKGGVMSKGMAIVGEAGPELLTMLNGKTIVRPLNGNEASENFGNGVTPSNTTFNQTNNICSPKALSPAETARQVRRASKQLLLGR